MAGREVEEDVASAANPVPRAHLENLPRTIWWDQDEETGRPGLYLVDQSRLPLRGDILCCNTVEGAVMSIKSMAVRGAPALALAGAYGLALWAYNETETQDVDVFLKGLDAAAEVLSTARPTAINLSQGVERAKRHVHARASEGASVEELREGLLACAETMRDEDEAANRAIGKAGAALLKLESKVMTICNAGSLATAFFGTALGVVYAGFDEGKVGHVWACETRPANQGGRLTSWELMMAGIPAVLISDSMAASVMRQGWVDCVIVGADRICANGDTANKIGTYMLAILAHEHGIPFYVAAPTTSIDIACASGDDVPIEQRDPRELEGVTVSGVIEPDDDASARALDLLTEQGERVLKLQNGHQMQIGRKGGAYGFDAWFRTTPPGVTVYNPAFDVTPARYVTAIITEQGVVYPSDDGEFSFEGLI